jgi:His-Xaa-Ser repeat protein HxsA
VTQKRYLIPSLLAAGFSAPAVADKTPQIIYSIPSASVNNDSATLALFRKSQPILLAGHSSHRSHSSHSSHRSSSSGGYSYPVYSPPPPVRSSYPTPVYIPRTPTPSPPTPPTIKDYSVERPTTLYGTPGSASEPDVVLAYVEKVKKVQMGLKAYGYYKGDIDGDVGPLTGAALERLQNDYGLKVTGTITPEVLKTFEISD